MTDIERMAREAGIDAVRHLLFRRERGQRMTLSESEAWESVLRFAELVRADERERLASWIEEQRAETPAHGWEFAAAIRALPPSP